MQRKNCHPVPSFVLKDRSNQELLDGAKHLVGRHRTVTAHLIAHLAEIYARKLHVVEGFSYLDQYCIAALGLSEDEANRRAHAAVLAHKYPVILDMLLEGSIHLTTLRVVGKCLTPKNHRHVLEGARGKSKTELEHLAAALCPQPDVPTVLRKLPEPTPETGLEETRFTSERTEEPAGAEAASGAVGSLPDYGGNGPAMPLAVPPAPSAPRKSRLAPLSPRRYNLQVTVDEETYDALKQLQDLLRHQIRNGDLARIIKDSVLERLEHVKREKFGHTKRPRRAREQESWIEEEKSSVMVPVVEEKPAPAVKDSEESPIQRVGAGAEKRLANARSEGKKSVKKVKGEETTRSAAIAPGRFQMNSRHIPNAVKREVWERDKGRCAFVSRSGRRCSEKGRLEFHHVHAYALGGPATVENIALRCRTHNAHEGVALFGQKVFRRAAERDSNRPGAEG